MEMQFIVKIYIMHVKGLSTKLAQVCFFNPFKFVNAYVVIVAGEK